MQVKVKLNLHGVVGVESVQQVDEEEYEEKVKRPIVKVPHRVSLMAFWCRVLRMYEVSPWQALASGRPWHVDVHAALGRRYVTIW